MHFDTGICWRIDLDADRRHALIVASEAPQSPLAPTSPATTIFDADSPSTLPNSASASVEGPAEGVCRQGAPNAQLSTLRSAGDPILPGDWASEWSDDAERRLRELSLRVGPLRQAWEARGPGAWLWCRRAAGLAELRHLGVTILPVQPLCGGGSRLNLIERTIVVEALLHDLLGTAPEWLRILRQLVRTALIDRCGIVPSSGEPISLPNWILPVGDLLTLAAARHVDLPVPGGQLGERDAVEPLAVSSGSAAAPLPDDFPALDAEDAVRKRDEIGRWIEGRRG